MPAAEVRGLPGAFSKNLFGAGFGIAFSEDDPDQVDYYYWGGSNNTGFFIDPDGTVGVQMSSCYRCRQAMFVDIEQMVDEAKMN